MRSLFLRRSIVALFLALPLASSRPTIAADTDPASWVPANALFYVGVADIEQLIKDYKSTAGFKMLEDAKTGGGPSVMAVVTKGFERFQERLAKMLDVPAGQLKNPFKGPAAMYATVPDGKLMKDMEPGLVAGVGDRETMQGYYDAAIKKMKESAGSHESVSAGSHTIDVFTKKENADNANDNSSEDDDFDGDPLSMDEDELAAFLDKHLDKMFSPDSMPDSLATCLTDDRLIIAPTADQVKNVLRSGEGGSLLDSDEHKSLVRTFNPLGSLRMLVNLQRMFELARTDPDSDDDDKKMMAALGTDGMQAVIGHYTIGTPEYDGKAEFQLLLKGERVGLSKILCMENGDIAPPAAVAANTTIFASVNLNVIAVLDEVEPLMRQVDPDAADQMRKSMESIPNPAGAGDPLNLRKEILENLRPPLQFHMSFSPPYGADSTRLLMSLGHKDKDAITKLMGFLGQMVTPRDVRGTQVYDFAFGGIAFAPTNDQVMVGNVKAIEAALAGAGADSLASAPEFQRAAAHVGKEAWAVFYLDYAKMLEAVIGFAANKAELQGAGMMNAGAGMALGMLEAFGSSLGDDPETNGRKMLKYAAPAMMTIETNADGLRLTGVQLKPKEQRRVVQGSALQLQGRALHHCII